MAGNKLGLVLSGGGGKGAYQIGVWEAMREYGFDRQVQAVAGTSVGGLNGALFVQNDFEKARRVWLDVESKNLLTLDDSQLFQLVLTQLTDLSLPMLTFPGLNLPALEALLKKIPDLKIPGLDPTILKRAGKGLEDLISGPIQTPDLEPVRQGLLRFMHGMRTKGLFKKEGLERMIAESIDPRLVCGSGIPLTVTAHAMVENRLDYFKLTDPDQVAKLLLATAAIPYLFDDVMIDDTLYVDGGFHWFVPDKMLDNTPVRPVVAEGCDTIVVVYLERTDLQMEHRNFPGVRILPVVPDASLGSHMEGLDFSNEGARRRMQQGYEDARHLFQHWARVLENEADYEALWDRALSQESTIEVTVERSNEADARFTSLWDDIQRYDKAISGDRFDEVIELNIPEQAESALLLENANLLDEIDRQELTSGIDDFIKRNRNNGQLIEGATMEALACLSAVPGSAAEVQEKNWFRGLIDGISGKTRKQLARNDRDLAMAQFAALRLVQETQARNLLSFEFTLAVNNRLNAIHGEVARLGERQNKALKQVYRSMSLSYLRLRNEMVRHAERLEAVERQLRVHDLMLHPDTRTYDGIAYRNLGTVPLLACLANDFYLLTGGNWKVPELLSLKQLCVNLGIHERPFKPGDFFRALATDRPLARRLTRSLDGSQGGSAALPTPSRARLLQDLRQNRPGELLERRVTGIEHAAEMEAAIPTYSFLVDLLFHMRLAGFVARKGQALSAEKAGWCQKLDTLAELVTANQLSPTFSREIADFRTAIEGFQLAVPLIGSFSSGKSSLINAYLGHSIQREALGAETAFATEFHLAEPDQEKLVVHHVDGSTRTLPLDQMEIVLSDGSQIARLEQHRALDVLARFPDLVLVDMPGFESANEAHNRAIQNYMKEGLTFLLCIKAGKTLSSSVLRQLDDLQLLGRECRVLVCMADLLAPDELRATLAHLHDTVRSRLGPDVVLGTTSAVRQDVADLEEALAAIDRKKSEFFRARFTDGLEGLIHRIERALQQQLQVGDHSIEILQERIRRIEEGSKELLDVFEDEKRAVLTDCGTRIASGVVSDVMATLRPRKAGFVDQLIQEKSIESELKGLVQSAFKLALEGRLRERLNSARHRLGKAVFAAFDQDITIDVGDPLARAGGANKSSWLGSTVAALGVTAAGAASAELVGVSIGTVLGPIGMIVGGIIGGLVAWIMGAKAREERKEKLGQALDEVFGKLEQELRPRAAEALEQMTIRAFADLKEGIDQRLEQERDSVARLREQASRTGQEQTRLREQAKTGLTRLKTLGAPAFAGSAASVS